MSKSLVFLEDFSKEEIYEIFKLTDKFRRFFFRQRHLIKKRKSKM